MTSAIYPGPGLRGDLAGQLPAPPSPVADVAWTGRLGAEDLPRTHEHYVTDTFFHRWPGRQPGKTTLTYRTEHVARQQGLQLGDLPPFLD